MTVKLEMTVEQAQAVDAALDFYSRICTGQLEEIVALAQFGVLGPHLPEAAPRTAASPEKIQAMGGVVNLLKDTLGYPHNGSYGIGHPHVDISGTRAWEVKKALTKALSEFRDPNPSFRGPAYDGNLVRYTNDPEPKVSISADSYDSAVVNLGPVAREMAHAGWRISMRNYPVNDGVNLAVVLGPASGNAFVVDIDVSDEDLSAKVQDIAEKVLGKTPLRRVSQSPRVALVYRHTEDDVVARRSLRFADRNANNQIVKSGNGVDIMSNGQTVTFHGGHRRTGRDYTWLEGTPRRLGPDAAPIVTSEMIAEFIEAVDDAHEFYRGSSFDDSFSTVERNEAASAPGVK